MLRLLLSLLGIALPVLAQEPIFQDGFENHPPVIVSSPLTTTPVGSPYSYDVDGEDVDGDALSYLLTTAPAGMSIDPATGLIQWLPEASGTFPVVVEVSDGQGGFAIQAWDLSVLEIVDSDADGLSDDDEIIAGTNPNDPDTDDDGVLDGAEVITHLTDPLDPDSDDDMFLDGSELAVGTDPLDPEDYPDVPLDPQNVAPESDPSVAVNVRDTTAFLHTGPDPIQTGVAPETIDLVRAALLRGAVFTRLGAPLPGVTVSVIGHPEFGSTLSRADGMFDLAVNGGGPLTIDYHREGFLPAQRTVEARWQEWASVPDVALIPLDPVVTLIDLSVPGEMKVARGSMQTDNDGSRQATILFPAGVTAELRMPDDSTMPIGNLSVRATEFTVGDSGEMAMPGALPPTSGYTYAVELSVDEAMAMGATSVDFDQPLPFYVENFLGFPAGTPVPTGYYDRKLGTWVPASDGLVIKMVGETGGMADVDIDGDDAADTGSPLSDLGVTDAERTQIAALYEPGQSLWRVPVAHFTSWDHNWPIGPPANAVYPNQSRSATDLLEDGICEIPVASSVECQNQVLRERVAITGTPFTLNYHSGRTPGRTASRHLDIPVTGDTVPASLQRVDVSVAVAGQVYDFSYDAAPGLVQPLTWDGLDAYGRPVQGAKAASIRLGYVYEGVYRTGGSGTASFGQPGQAPIEVEGNRTRADFILPQAYQAVIGAWDARGQGLGGWTLNVHHAYDPQNKVLYRGDGTKRSAEHIPAVLDLAVGLLDEEGYAIRCIPSENPTCGVGLPAREASLAPVSHIAFGPDSSLYITQSGLNQVRRVGPSGILENFAGTGEGYVCSEDGTSCPNGDGGPAVDAKFVNPYSLAADAFGNVYIGEISQGTQRIRKVDQNGIITTYAGGGTIWPPVGPVSEISIWPLDMEIDATGNLYVTDYCHIVRIDTGGYSSLIAGTEDPDICDENTGDGGPAALASIGAEGIALGPDGSIYLTESFYGSVRKITKDGIIQTVAGTGTRGFSGDGGPALNAQFAYLYDVAVTPDGGIFIPDWDSGHLRYIDGEGVVRSVAGVGFSFDESGMFGPALNAWLYPFYIKLGPDGNVYLPLGGNDASVRVIKSPMSGPGGSDLLVPAEDGSEVYRFNSSGRHLQTLHALTGSVLYEFAYDPDGRLANITDGDGKLTTIERNGSGNPTAIVGPFGQITTLAAGTNGFLETITNPANESLQIQSGADGLIMQLTDPRGRISSYGYDDLGRLTSQSDNGGQSQSLARIATPGAMEVSRTSGMGRLVTYEVLQESDKLQNNSVTAPDSSQATTQFNRLSGTTNATSATGMSSTITEKADPRFGMQSPILQSAEVSAPGGPSMTVSSTSMAELADPDDPFSLVSLSGSATVEDRTTHSTYTAATKILEQTTPAGRVSTVQIDDLGRVVYSQFGDLAPVITEYNALGQIISLTQGMGEDARVTTFTHGSNGYLDGLTDPLGRSISFSHDAAGRVMSKTLPGNVEVLFGYNPAGELDGITPPGQPEHVLEFNLHGQLVSYAPPAVANSGPTAYAYNVDRQLASKMLPGGDAVNYAYDDQGRLLGIDLSEGGMEVAAYVMSYDVANRIDGISGPGAQLVTFGYQGDLAVSKSWSGSVEGSITWSHDNSFRLSSETVTGGTTVNFVYDADDLLINAGALAITRNASNGLAQSATLGVLADNWTYNPFGEVTHYAATSNGTPLFESDHTVDDLGRITQTVETINGMTDTFDYEYDLQGQLTEVQKNSIIVESYSYDDNGNRLNGTVYSEVSSGSYDAQDRLLSYGASTYEYDPVGRLATRTDPGMLVTTFDYDPVGNLRGATLPDSTEILYGLDGTDRRVQRSVDGSVTQRFLYDGFLPVAELDGLGNVVSQFVYADGSAPVYLIKGGVNFRLVTDKVGSVRLVVNASNGNIAQRIDYDTFGNVINDTNPGFQPFGFAGGLYDSLSGLVHFGTRDYDPKIGRWTAKDLAGFSGLDANLYRYAHNNPVNFSDPGGTFWTEALGFVSGAGGRLRVLLNPGLIVQATAEGIANLVVGLLGFEYNVRNPLTGPLFPDPPYGMDESTYRDYEFYGECAVDVASLAVTGGPGALRSLSRFGNSVSGSLGRLADKLRNIPELIKGLGNAFSRAGKTRPQLPPKQPTWLDNVDQQLQKLTKEYGNGGDRIISSGERLSPGDANIFRGPGKTQ